MIKSNNQVVGTAINNRILIEIPNFPLSVTSYWVPVGSSQDPVQKQGLSHLLEHLVGARTTKYPNRFNRLKEIEKRGFYFNATTTKTLQRYYYLHDSSKAGEANFFLTDSMYCSIFLEKDVEAERKVIINEEKSNYYDISQYIWRLADKGIWNGTGMAQDIYGTSESLHAISKVDLEEYYEKYFKESSLLEMIINGGDKSIHYDIENSGENCSYTPMDNTLLPYVFERRDTTSTHLGLTFITTPISNIQDRIVLDCLRAYLANGWMSRLIQILRISKKLTYWVLGSTYYTTNSGYLRFYLDIYPSDFNKVIGAFEKEIIALKEKLLSEKVLQEHLYKFISDIKRISLDIDWIIWWYGWQATLSSGPLLLVSEYIQLVQKVTPSQIREMARKYLLKENFSIAEIGKKSVGNTELTFQ